jgi:hypothetical protein
MRTEYGRKKSLLAARSSFIELAVVVILLSLGVNMIAGTLLGWFGTHRLLTLAVALAVTLAAFGYMMFRAVPRDFKFNGVLVVYGGAHDLVKIDRYRLSEEMVSYFRALAAENKVLLKIWTGNPLRPGPPTNDPRLGVVEERGVGIKDSPAVKLVREAVEYFVLQELSFHLDSHFSSNYRVVEDEIARIGRKEIPSVLLENHFLELFSRPMEEREPFANWGGTARGQDRLRNWNRWRDFRSIRINAASSLKGNPSRPEDDFH